MTEVSKISKESEKQAIELQAQGNMPLPFKPVLPVDTKSVTPSNQVDGTKLAPRLDTPASLDNKTYEKGVKDLNKFLEKVTNIESLVNEVMLFLSEQGDSYMQVQRTFLDKDRAYVAKQEQERAKSAEAEREASRSAETWGTVTKSVTTVALLVVSTASLAAGATPLAAAGIILSVSKLFDMLLDDMLKKKVASWMARGDTESEKAWVGRIQLFAEVASIALSFGLGAGQAAQVAMNITGSATTAMKSLVDYRASTSRALREELAEKCRVAHKSIEQTIETMYESCDMTRHMQQMTHQIDEGRMRLSHLLLRPVIN